MLERKRNQLAVLAKFLDRRLVLFNPFGEREGRSIDDWHYSLIEFAASGDPRALSVIHKIDMRPCLQRYCRLIMDLSL